MLFRDKEANTLTISKKKMLASGEQKLGGKVGDLKKKKPN